MQRLQRRTTKPERDRPSAVTHNSPLRHCPRLQRLSGTVHRFADQPERLLYVRPGRGITLPELRTRRRPPFASSRAQGREALRLGRFLKMVVREVQGAAQNAGQPDAAQGLQDLQVLAAAAPLGPLTLGQLHAPTLALRRFVRTLGSLPHVQQFRLEPSAPVAVQPVPEAEPVEPVEEALETLDLAPLIAHMDQQLAQPQASLSLMGFSVELVDHYVEKGHMDQFVRVRRLLQPALRALTVPIGVETWPSYIADFPELHKLYVPDPAMLPIRLDGLPARLRIIITTSRETDGSEVHIQGLRSRSVRIGSQHR